ncbi:Gamma-glutamylputrescine synthetase PuuA [Jannaschia seosinensis]|uniref:Gamma-glutamylputrescine synthetase PuuA n=1 Tax=Jannaschia seosinensis TaxID=313367 RepID=A0A0M7BB41_9RHOB|nr:glutamine synthetase family protein [Jannaschia seosinensis]CUH40007.1 Gamma-glutamylputrescine synthetase PuuA [Jannaschia seosinensis]
MTDQTEPAQANEATTPPETLFACICDLNGVMRGKRLPVGEIDKIAGGGMRMPLSICGPDIWGEDVEGSALLFETGDADGTCEATGRGPLPLSWTNRPTSLIPMWMREESGAPFLGDPRRTLDEVVSRWKARGLTPVVATELEFYLIDPSGRVPQPPVSPVTGLRSSYDGALSLDDLEHFERFLDEIYDACALQGIPADSAISENGAGQFEVNMRHLPDPLRAADDAVLFKRLVRGIARKHGMAATFMAKPYGDRSGSGFHVHFSVVDEAGKNVFDDGGPDGSDMMRAAVAGLLATAQECALTFAPHENSFRRLLPGTHAPSSVAWGYENRTAAIRIPGGAAPGRRIEHRIAGADANPYLVLASILGGALMGIERDLTPAAPITGDAYSKDLPHLPLDWATAIKAFAEGDNIPAIYSRRLRRMLLDCKRQEQKQFNRHVSEFEFQTYLEVV